MRPVFLLLLLSTFSQIQSFEWGKSIWVSPLLVGTLNAIQIVCCGLSPPENPAKDDGKELFIGGNSFGISTALVSNPFSAVSPAPEAAAWPLFEFWNPLTWLKPRFSSEAMIYIMRGGREPNRRLYQQLKKSLLPANIFFGNLRAQYAAWDLGKKKLPEKSSGSGRPKDKKFNKKSARKQE